MRGCGTSSTRRRATPSRPCWCRPSVRWLPNSPRRLRRVRCWRPSAVARGPLHHHRPCGRRDRGRIAATGVGAACGQAEVAAELPVPRRPSRDRRYRVTDPYPRFWLRLLGPSTEEIERGRGDLTLARIRENRTSWHGRAVEPLVREALARMLPDDRLSPAPAVGGYWARTTSRSTSSARTVHPSPRICSSWGPSSGWSSRPPSGGGRRASGGRGGPDSRRGGRKWGWVKLKNGLTVFDAKPSRMRVFGQQKKVILILSGQPRRARRVRREW